MSSSATVPCAEHLRWRNCFRWQVWGFFWTWAYAGSCWAEFGSQQSSKQKSEGAGTEHVVVLSASSAFRAMQVAQVFLLPSSTFLTEDMWIWCVSYGLSRLFKIVTFQRTITQYFLLLLMSHNGHHLFEIQASYRNSPECNSCIVIWMCYCYIVILLVLSKWKRDHSSIWGISFSEATHSTANFSESLTTS